ncbi:MAG: hypothetical protein ACREN5_01170 [Gemmatimonadales bacterium]
MSVQGEADDQRRRDPAWVLGEALRLADAIWENEDRNVERRPGYDAETTVNAAVELAGAVKALDGLLQSGYPLPHAWRKMTGVRGGAREYQIRLRGWRRGAWRLIRVRAVGDSVGWFQRRVPGARRWLGKLTEPWRWKQR